MKEFDGVTEAIMAVFGNNDNRFMTATQITCRIFDNRMLDSNSPEYKKVLLRLNKMNEAGYMETKYINPYTPTKWRMSDSSSKTKQGE